MRQKESCWTVLVAIALLGMCNEGKPAQALSTLFDAVASGDIKRTRELIVGGADVNAKRQADRTALHDAAAGGHLAIVELLLAHGAKVDARTSFGATPLDLAAQQGYLNVAGMLIASGADVNSRSQSGTSILYDAIKGGHYGVVELLVENGADVNVRTAAGRTPLEVAREAGREDIVQVLTHRAAGASDAGNSERDVNMPTQPRTDRMTTAYRLENTLKTMGIVDAFNDPRVTPKTGDRADFSAMDGARDLFIIAVIHKALVEVSEEGTEAAAVTAVAMAGGGPPPPPVFRADHPFLFLIQKNDTGDILFMGRVATPGEETK